MFQSLKLGPKTEIRKGEEGKSHGGWEEKISIVFNSTPQVG
jgi:hypothetical protein